MGKLGMDGTRAHIYGTLYIHVYEMGHLDVPSPQGQTRNRNLDFRLQ